MKNERKNLKRNQLISFGITLIAIVVINIIASFIYTRFDLTSEKRYTLSDTSKEVLKNLDDYVYFRVYLEGDFPAGFKKLRKENEEIIKFILDNNKNIELVPLDLTNYQDLPKLPTLNGTLCVCPTKYYEGFYVAKIRKIK